MSEAVRPTFREWLLGGGYSPETMSAASKAALFPTYQSDAGTPADVPATWGQVYMDVAPPMYAAAGTAALDTLSGVASAAGKAVGAVAAGIFNALGPVGILAVVAGAFLLLRK